MHTTRTQLTHPTTLAAIAPLGCLCRLVHGALLARILAKLGVHESEASSSVT